MYELLKRSLFRARDNVVRYMSPCGIELRLLFFFSFHRRQWIRVAAPRSRKRIEEEGGGAMASEHAEPKQKQSLMDKAKEFVADKIAHIPKPEATLDGVSFKSMSRECITLHSNVNVSNPYDHRLPICEVTYTLKCAGKVVASGTVPDPGWIAASDTTKLEIPAKVPYDFLISLMKDVGRDWDIDYELQVGLTVDLPIIGNFTIPLSTSGEFKLPTLKDMF